MPQAAARAIPPSISLAARLRELNLPVRRLKTGTPPRIDARSVRFFCHDSAAGGFPVSDHVIHG